MSNRNPKQMKQNNVEEAHHAIKRQREIKLEDQETNTISKVIVFTNSGDEDKKNVQRKLKKLDQINNEVKKEEGKQRKHKKSKKSKKKSKQSKKQARKQSLIKREEVQKQASVKTSKKPLQKSISAKSLPKVKEESINQIQRQFSRISRKKKRKSNFYLDKIDCLKWGIPVGRGAKRSLQKLEKAKQIQKAKSLHQMKQSFQSPKKKGKERITPRQLIEISDSEEHVQQNNVQLVKTNQSDPLSKVNNENIQLFRPLQTKLQKIQNFKQPE